MITLSNLTPITQALPEPGTTCLIYTEQGGYAVAKYTNWHHTYGYRLKEPWFWKGGRQMSKRVVGWCELIK